MPRVSAFIFELETKEGEDFDNLITKTFNKLKVNLNNDLPWEGFLTKINASEIVASEQ